MQWWLAKSWNEQQQLKQEQLGPNPQVSSMPLSYFNPDCKHERCSSDILTCPACIDYTTVKNLENDKTNTKN